MRRLTVPVKEEGFFLNYFINLYNHGIFLKMAVELLWRFIFSFSVFLLIVVLHKWVGRYPHPLALSNNAKKELKEVFVLWLVAVLVPVARIFVITPWLNEYISGRFFLELAYLPLVLITYLAIPGYIVLVRGGWSRSDIGLTWRVKSASPAVFAVTLGLISGIVAYTTDQAVIGSDPISAGTLLLLLFNNDFIEEFIHRGIIQSKLEKVFGQIKAILLGGVLFGLTHIAYDITALSGSGVIFIFFAFLLQTMLGWLLGIIYMKTRSLWPGVACHFLVNWLPSILVGLMG